MSFTSVCTIETRNLSAKSLDRPCQYPRPNAGSASSYAPSSASSCTSSWSSYVRTSTSPPSWFGCLCTRRVDCLQLQRINGWSEKRDWSRGYICSSLLVLRCWCSIGRNSCRSLLYFAWADITAYAKDWDFQTEFWVKMHFHTISTRGCELCPTRLFRLDCLSQRLMISIWRWKTANKNLGR